jgi:RNA polymerase sigma-70 factor (ECF subfamily)
MMSEPGEVTGLLARWSGGDGAALDELMAVVYNELKKIADGYLYSQRTGHTLQPTALVHEAWLRLVKQERPNFQHRKQFFGLAAQVMRRVLVDHARATNADKRGGGAAMMPLSEVAVAGNDQTIDLLALDQALDRLAAVSGRQSRVIELRYFGGLNVQEMADVLGVSPATVSRDQKFAEAWLGDTLRRGL